MAIVPHGQALTDDGSRKNVLQAPVRFLTNWNQKSPHTATDVESFIDIPANCFAVVIQASGADLRVATGEGGTASTGTYDIVYNGNTRSYPVAGWNRLYLLRNSTTNVTVTFQLWLAGFLEE